MKKQTGFTLIELVIVVVILGFLAATAIPKFVDLTDQAKKANIEGMAGGFASGISLVRAQWEAEGRPSDATGNNFVDYDGVDVYLTVEDKDNNIRPGYVISTAQTNTIANVDCVDVWENIFQSPPRITDTFTDITNDNSDSYKYFASKETDNTNPICHYYLKESLNKNTDSEYVTPGVSTEVGNSFTYRPANSEVVVYIND